MITYRKQDSKFMLNTATKQAHASGIIIHYLKATIIYKNM
jgi:hypothetical protein